jgi:hypothetical protein
MGSISIHSGQEDIRYGPKPLSVSLRPLAGLGFEVTFKVQVDVIVCPGSGIMGFPQGLLEFVYTFAFNIDQSGYTKRTYQGHVRVASYRSDPDSTTLSDSADRLREQIQPLPPRGFRTVSQDYNLSEDKATLRFSIVQEQMPPNYPPEGVILCEADHTVETTSINYRSWNGTLNASYEMALGRGRWEAYGLFMQLVKDRISAAYDAARQPSSEPKPITDINSVFVPTYFSMREPEIYGRRCASFTLRYTLFTNFATAIMASGLWRPVPGNDPSAWDRWQTSMTVLGPRGAAGLTFQTQDDAVVNFCQNQIPQTPTDPGQLAPGGGPSAGLDQPFSSSPQLPDISKDLGTDTPPPPEQSWLRYSCYLTYRTIDDVAPLKPLPQKPLTYAVPQKPAVIEAGGDSVDYQNAPTTKMQVRAAPNMLVTCHGWAVRAGYDIPAPVLLSVGGAAAAPYNSHDDYFTTAVVSNVGYPIILARWQKTFRLTDIPEGELVSQYNPMLGGDVKDGSQASINQDDTELDTPGQGGDKVFDVTQQ